MKVQSLNRIRLLATPRTAAYQAPPSMGFSRQEYWSGVPLPSLMMCIKGVDFFSCSKKEFLCINSVVQFYGGVYLIRIFFCDMTYLVSYSDI